MKICTHSDVRLGDNMAHLHFLRALAKAHSEVTFQHAVLPSYLPQLIEVVADLPNIILRDIRHVNEASFDSWKNVGKFWERHDLRDDYGPFMLAWFEKLANQMGLESPFKAEADLLFDYPAIKDTSAAAFDFLIINSEPLSGQCRAINIADLDQLAIELSDRYKIMTTREVRPFIPCTQWHRMSTTAVGGLSRSCRRIIMISTGVSWATFNIWNKKSVEQRIILLDSERINIASNSTTVRSVDTVRAMLKADGTL